MKQQLKSILPKFIFYKQLKSILPKFIFYKKSNKPSIVIYGVRRGGTTWLSEIISSNGKFRNMGQLTEANVRPYYSAQIALKRKLLPSMLNYQYFLLSDRHKLELKTLFKDIEAGAYRILDVNFSFKKNRALYKLLNISYLSSWIKEEFDFKTVVILRHPISTALSLCNTGWPHDYLPYLDSNFIRENYLNTEMYEMAKTIDKTGSKIEKYVLEWLLKQQEIFQNMDRHFIVYYEDLVLNPESSAVKLEKKLNIEIDRKLFSKLSGSTVFSSLESKDLLKKDKFAKLSAWSNVLSIDEKRKIQNIFKVFNHQIYDVHSITHKASAL